MPLDIQQLSHFGLRVSNLDASLSFYVDLLGFEKLFERDYVDPRSPEVPHRIAACRVPGGPVVFELLQMGGAEQTIDGSKAPVMAFSVADIKETHRSIEAAGHSILMPPTEMAPGIVMLFILDPDGRTVECAEFSSGAQTLLANHRAENGDAAS